MVISDYSLWRANNLRDEHAQLENLKYTLATPVVEIKTGMHRNIRLSLLKYFKLHQSNHMF